MNPSETKGLQMAPNGGNGRALQRRPPATPVICERVALYLDLENLLHEHRQARDWDGAMVALASLVHELAARGALVARLAFGDAGLVRKLAFPLGRLGVRCHNHEGGPDGADLALLQVLEHEIPRSCGTVVIASGDHIFAPIARQLRAEGRRVEVVACAGTVSAELYASADAFTPFMTVEDGLALLGADEPWVARGSLS
jgi:hypothetical protein